MFEFDDSECSLSMYYIKRTQRDRLFAGYAVGFVYNQEANDFVSYIVNEYWEVVRSNKSVESEILDINVSIAGIMVEMCKIL